MLYPFNKGHKDKINRPSLSPDRWSSGKWQTLRVEQVKKRAVYRNGETTLSFLHTLWPPLQLPGTSCSIVQNTGCTYRKWALCFLPPSCWCRARWREGNVCGYGWEGQHTLLFASNQEGTHGDLCTWAHIQIECGRTQMQRHQILNIQTFNTAARHALKLVWLDTWSSLINWSASWLIGEWNKSSMAGSRLQHMSRQPTLFTTLYWFAPTQWPLEMWHSFLLDLSHPSSI